MRVIVLGASGMLGSMVLDSLRRDTNLEVGATTRDGELLKTLEARSSGVQWQLLDAFGCDIPEILRVIDQATWVINCIGVIKPYIHDDNPAEIERAISVNAVFPHLLAHAAEQCDAQVLQIATDCVYSGEKGNYSEHDKHDALDVYGKTKSLGEAYSDRVHHLRCSIIGPEPKRHDSLLDWFLNQPNKSTVSGYLNHRWNGVTTLHFARLCHGFVTQGLRLTHVQHVVPENMVSKAELLGFFAREFQRKDITISPSQADVVIDRTLSTCNDALNRDLWSSAGYTEPPSVERMVAELAAFDYRFASL
jgi:dTDP-4-dehydrorhamnose reductase